MLLLNRIAQGARKETVLHKAVYNGDLNAVKILLNYEADPNAEDVSFY